jgi:hypothetical protein
MGWLVRFMGQINTVELSFPIACECGEYVGAGCTIEHAGFNNNTRPSRTHNEIECFEAQVPRRPESLWAANLP